MELYLLKSAACLAIFFLFYKLLLEGTSFHVFKRGYLLGMVLISFFIPLVTITTYVEVSELANPILITTSSEGIETSGLTLVEILVQSIWVIYGLGVVFFSVRFIKNLQTILFRIQHNPKLKMDRVVNVLLKEKVTPHTFLSFIFLNKARFEAQEIPSEVLLHEQTHAKQNHSYDILFIELLQIVFWFNPFVHWIKHAVKLNHEFLADRAVLEKGIAPQNYQNILLTFSSNVPENYLANAIHYSFIKKRLTIMKTNTSKRTIWIKSLLILPLLAILLFSFSTTEVIEKDRPANEITPEVVQEKATAKQVAEYNKLAKKYNAQTDDNRFIVKKDVERLKYLYNIMSSQQRNAAEPFPSFPPPPPAPDAPKVKKGEKSDIPPPPPPAPDAPKVKKGQKSNVPPPPPPAPDAPKPENPIDYVVKMAKKGATFYYEDEKVSSDKAIDLMKKNKGLNIQITESNSANPKVQLSKKPIIVNTNNQTSVNSQGATEDVVGQIKKLAEEGAHFLLFDGGPHFKDGQKITLKRALEIVKKVNGLTIDVKDAGYLYKIVEIRMAGC
jgi:hypothetical protein